MWILLFNCKRDILCTRMISLFVNRRTAFTWTLEHMLAHWHSYLRWNTPSPSNQKHQSVITLLKCTLSENRCRSGVFRIVAVAEEACIHGTTHKLYCFTTQSHRSCYLQDDLPLCSTSTDQSSSELLSSSVSDRSAMGNRRMAATPLSWVSSEDESKQGRCVIVTEQLEVINKEIIRAWVSVSHGERTLQYFTTSIYR